MRCDISARNVRRRKEQLVGLNIWRNANSGDSTDLAGRDGGFPNNIQHFEIYTENEIVGSTQNSENSGNFG